METKINKSAWIALIITALISAVSIIFFTILHDDNAANTESSNMLASVFFDIAYISAVCFMIIAALLAVGFALYQLILLFFENSKAAIRITLSLLAMGFVFLLSYLLSSSTDIPIDLFEATSTNIASSRLIGAGVISVYFMSIATAVAVAYTEIKNLLK